MTNAAIQIHPDAFDTGRPRLLGRHSAGESFLRGFLRYADVEEYLFWGAGGFDRQSLQTAIERIEPIRKPVRWFADFERPDLKAAGVVQIPEPFIDREAWARRAFGAGGYSITGLTHTIANERTMGALANYLIAPLEPHDALICTSAAVRASVETLLDGVRDYLTTEYGGPRRREEPMRVTIPLGIDAAAFERSPQQRKAWRERLDIPDDAIVALYVGRFNIFEKMNPALMAMALERTAAAVDQPIHWVVSGWASEEDKAEDFHAATRALCPSVRYVVVDGRPLDVRYSIWSVADLFISFSDNIQESFGLTPVEAMAAGLPSVITDWNGYRDSVRHGEDGFRIDTVAPAPGDGRDMSYWHARGAWTYSGYVASVGQLTSVDFCQAVEALSALASDPDLRRRQGAQAQARARSVFDWSAVIPQYQALWAEQNARRLATPSAAPATDPFHPDPFSLFSTYPTRHFKGTWSAALGPEMTAKTAIERLSSPLAAYGLMSKPTIAEVEQIVAWLGEQPGLSGDEISARFPAPRRNAILRGLQWLARFGVIELTPS